MENKNLENKKIDSIKDIILNNYNEVLKEKKEKESKNLDPEKTLEKKYNKEIIENSNKIITENSDNKIKELEKTFDLLINSFDENISKEDTIENAIQIKKIELEKIKKVVEEAFKLSKLVKSQQEELEFIDKKIKEEKEIISNKLKETKENLELEKKDFEEKLKLEKNELDKIRKIKEDEFEYEFEKDKKIAEDNFKDKENLLRKEVKEEIEKEIQIITEKSKELELVEKELIEKEKELPELKEKIEKYPEELEKLKTDTNEKVSERIKSELILKESYLKKDFEGQKEVFKNEIEDLEKMILDFETKNKELAEKLDNAYEKIQNMALKTIENRSN